jgi:preprotein translocase subunit SecG
MRSRAEERKTKFLTKLLLPLFFFSLLALAVATSKEKKEEEKKIFLAGSGSGWVLAHDVIYYINPGPPIRSRKEK